MKKKIYGENTAHPSIANSLNNIGLTLSDLGRYEQALSYDKQALAMEKKIYGQDTAHPFIADSLNNIGLALGSLGRHEEALGHYNQALKMYRRLGLPDTHPDPARTLSNIQRLASKDSSLTRVAGICVSIGILHAVGYSPLEIYTILNAPRPPQQSKPSKGCSVS